MSMRRRYRNLLIDFTRNLRKMEDFTDKFTRLQGGFGSRGSIKFLGIGASWEILRPAYLGLHFHKEKTSAAAIMETDWRPNVIKNEGRNGRKQDKDNSWIYTPSQ